MEFNIYNKEDFKTTEWAGGTTTELFISPQNADYGQRDFSIRLSTATVEVSKSEFTPLPGVARTLMVLDGRMTLVHEGHHRKTLDKFDVDEFDGGWNTASEGMCTDFNLMTIGKVISSLSAVALQKGQVLDFALDAKWNWQFIYLYSGQADITLNNEKHALAKGSLLAVREPTTQIAQIKNDRGYELVFCNVGR